ncbi:hypothetical protein [Rhodohalobacter sp.]|uniref:hypothetical protein n=1 Tax=Rhodohalobacter sp. TaxID=1974210 RepID=UPI002ACF06B1|nr:hypothetical protein [Rhodohalobacter sp.]MDZ7757284.1 hypothetical protein [Rhodohalobacter sp.]
MMELKEKHGFTAKDVEKIDIEIFDVAFNIIGGGEEGDKTIVRTKEEADHNLQYVVSAALVGWTSAARPISTGQGSNRMISNNC